MSTIGLAIGLAVVLATLAVTWTVFALRVRRAAWGRELADVAARVDDESHWPLVSVIVACRNEALHVAAALQSLLRQDYPAFELIVVDDRSTDGSGAILDGLARADPRVRVEHVTQLPAGWLGKNHALHIGAARARGAWLLFTDADVHFAPGALRRSLAWATARDLGHGVALPRFDAPGFCERAFVSLFALLLLGSLRISQLGRAGSRAYIGAGAFNLVRADAYRSVGGHAPLRLEVADDLKLGMILRRSGVRQGCILAGDQVHVRWQDGFWGSLRGMHKNFFAGLEYQWWRAPAVAVGVGALTCGPLLAALAPFGWVPGWVRAVAGVIALAGGVLLGATARRVARGSGLEGLALPLAGLGVAYVAVASAALAALRGGIVWRGTRYPLSELRAGCVRERDWSPARAVGASDE